MSADISASSNRLPAPPRRLSLRVITLELLCVMLALVEGAFAAAVFMTAALVYHLFVLEVVPEGALLGLFLAFAATVGLTHATLAFRAFSRRLSKAERLSRTLTQAFYSWLASFGIGLLLAFVFGVVGDLSRVSIVSSFVIGLPLAIVLRALLSRVMTEQIAAGHLQYERVAVVGQRAHVATYLFRNDIWRHGRKLSSALYLEDVLREDGAIARAPVAAFAAQSLERGVESVLFVGDHAAIEDGAPVIDLLRRYSINIDLIPIELGRFRILEVVQIGATAALRIISKPLPGPAQALKRMADIAGALAGLMLLAPVFAVAAVAIKLESRGPVFFRQERRGFNGSTFRIWKFRSMRVREDGHSMTQARRDDDRITRVGRVLRATSIDELPQLINVLSGEMSIVGPRPHAVSHDAELIEKLGEYAYRNRIKPGITGWAQVNGYRGETRTPEQIEARVQHDLYYIDNWSIFLDLWILILTVFSPRTHRGAF